jgi:hypothetical protein
MSLTLTLHQPSLDAMGTRPLPKILAIALTLPGLQLSPNSRKGFGVDFLQTFAPY